jgi:hypothetical protein
MTKVMFEMLDLTKYNADLDKILKEVILEIVAHESAFRKEHEGTKDMDSMREIRFVLLKAVAVLSQNLMLKTLSLIDDADMEIARRNLGLKDGYATR